ncbi:YdbH domain-containing protein [Novosphingobium cyanobacteriorum]|uniref:YdbH domain-containing protein n=1 Tax=Novosphingobium cyanobacteriorum TaxID=3024215 RepID=A0ABT6CHM0_9SPHN|nr:YdbH domain-containing protein [Novosphingobium cyanobacteriorum]MDF8333429.1 YdbH domain-containing protein [Novosphingobium cyanobacteriorum]
MANGTDLAQGSQSHAPVEPDDGETMPASRRSRRRALIAGGSVFALVLGGAWALRERIAGHFIDQQLTALDVPATYRIESIGPGVQVLRDIVVGDPRRPDLTVERAEVYLGYGLGTPFIHEVRVHKPRLYGTYLNGKLSFGRLDEVLFAPGDGKPVRLPDLSLVLDDARGLVDSDHGRLAFKAEGRGNLRNGFAGSLAALMPEVRFGDCRTGRATLFGKVSIAKERPRLTGPMRLDRLACGSSVALQDATLDLDLTGDKDLKGAIARGKLRSGAFVAGSAGAESLALDTALALRDGALSGRVAANAGGVRSGGASIGLLGLDGLLRVRDSFSTVEFRGTVDGQGLRRGPAFDRALQSAQASAQGTLLAPMAAQVRTALAREERGSSLGGDVTVRRNTEGWSVVVPSMTLRGGSGAALATLSRVQLTGDGRRTPRLAGSFATGGAGLPRITGQMERAGNRRGGGAQFRLAMAPYRAGNGELAVPDMVVAQVADGSLGFSGTARLSGAIPGGSVQNLNLPVQGALSGTGALALYRRCITPRFDRLVMGQMALDGRSVTLCPVAGQPMVRSDARGLRIAAGAANLLLSGKLGETPMRLDSGAVGFAWPGTLTARGVNVVLGPEDTAARFRLNDLVARLGKDFSGTFGGVEARLAAVPLDVTNASGEWRYTDGALVLSNASYDLTDRTPVPRFEKLLGRNATLTLADSRIVAETPLIAPKTGQEVARATIRHDLGNGTGHADLAVPGLLFADIKGDTGLQPADLTRLALGVVANVAGTVKGTGRIDWNERGVTSTGTFGTDRMDLAAAFGPVKGLAGTLRFTDLLGMETAPHQQLSVASVNPGIEVTDGKLDVQMLAGQVLRLNSAQWPFLGGTIALEPTELHLGIAEARQYTLTIVGLDAARFLERMDLSNLSATGIFDGQLPLVFDANGGRIEGGNLVSRPPGGNVSYVGALTYKDLSAMANFAFDALKSMDYQTMTIAMRGDLEGEIVTNVKFGGVKQGAGTKKNFVTRQIANLPIQFNVNIRAPFYALIGTAKSMYDPSTVKDPRELGLVDAQGRALRRQNASFTPPAMPIQTPVSRTLP